MKNVRTWVALILFYSGTYIPGICQEGNTLKPHEKIHELILNVGGAATNQTSFTYAPIISLIYLKKTSIYFGNHWEAAIGIGETYGGIAWQFDVWLQRNIRLGAGFGVMPFINAMPGNPIIIPMPELSIGTHFQIGKLTYSGGVTGNLGYGVRGTVGMGYCF